MTAGLFVFPYLADAPRGWFLGGVFVVLLVASPALHHLMTLYTIAPTLAALTADDRGDLLLYITLGLISLLAAVASVAKIYEAFWKPNGARKTDSITRAEFEGFVKLTEARFKDVDDKFTGFDKDIRNLIQTLTSELRSIHRSIGRLDGLISGSKGVDTETGKD